MKGKPFLLGLVFHNRPLTASIYINSMQTGSVRQIVNNMALATAAAAAGAAALVVAPPAALGALGFTSAGIAAGSTASAMMSLSAIANGGGVAAGSVVAVCQSIGAAGLGAASGVVAGVGATAAVLFSSFF
ncbi:interferon alpha-inducible protein 27-like protein 1 [Nerophis ophidion]|uniref:interferon alpha-inducible protein 27-like protein 1 n=1 Tax=Nerophis ophidion TaxID=159077 RepID=UPI002ADFF980|nr:interferon alpha-inducible protein 27-like protein 1 [Nerophis ophidion]